MAYDRHIGDVKKYWVMVETGSPQFVAARSVVSIASSAIWFQTAITLVNLTFWFPTTAIKDFDIPVSNTAYGSSVIMIIIIQLAGVCVGTLSAAVKWFVFVLAMCSESLIEASKRHRRLKLFGHRGWWTGEAACHLYTFDTTGVENVYMLQNIGF